VDKKYDGVIGQWDKNGISPLDAKKLRLIYGTKADASMKVDPAKPTAGTGKRQ
jgi:hypothetical protein